MHLNDNMPSESADILIGTRIFLVGFMGSGKTHWGKIWADTHNLDFYNLDSIVEESEGMSINDIFHMKGEPYFRASETRALHLFAFQQNFLLSCGGGAPCFDNNMGWINNHGISIYLKPAIATIVTRLKDEASHRPLIKDIAPSELSSFIEMKLIEREPYYLKANLVLPEEKINMESLDGLLNLENPNHSQT